ncbi:MAG: DsbA family protein [Candidatus Paceibacterota bacterium]|jgi:protein-disulfide isomerase
MEVENTQQTQVSKTVAQTYAIPFAIIIAGLAIASAIYFGDSKKAAVAATGQGNAQVDPVTKDDHIVGNPNAKVVIVEYSDTECPYCKFFHVTMNRIMNDYGKDGQVAWVYRHLIVIPGHTYAQKEAESTECANKLGGNTKFWEFTNKVFEKTQGNNSLDPAELPKIASSIGLDVTAFNKCVASGEMKSIVDKNIASGLKAGANGTPNSFVLVDGKVAGQIEGAQPYENIKAGIDGILKQ